MVKLRTLVQTLVALGTNAYLYFPFGGAGKDFFKTEFSTAGLPTNEGNNWRGPRY
jgi:hypothetical protein